jgi:hypothetical protein
LVSLHSNHAVGSTSFRQYRGNVSGVAPYAADH